MKNKKYYIGLSAFITAVIVLPLVVGAAPAFSPPDGVTDANFNSVTAVGVIQNGNIVLEADGNILTTGGLIDGGSLYLNRADTNGDGIADATAGADIHLDGAIKNDSNAGFHYGRVLIDDEVDVSGRIRTSDPKITGSYTSAACIADGGQPYSPPVPGASQVCLLKVRFSDGIDVGGDIRADKAIITQGITAQSISVSGPITATEFPNLTLSSVYSFLNPTNSTRSCAITGVANSCGSFTCRYYTCLSPV